MSSEHGITSQGACKEAVIWTLLPHTSGVQIAQSQHDTLIYESKSREIASMLTGSLEDEFGLLAETAAGISRVREGIATEASLRSGTEEEDHPIGDKCQGSVSSIRQLSIRQFLHPPGKEATYTKACGKRTFAP